MDADTFPVNLDLAEKITLACLAEVIASKPGNVHRGADFTDLTFGDFALSAVVVGQALAQPPVGRSILHAIRRTQHWTGRNTNLGIALLLGPLAAASATSPTESLQQTLANVLDTLTPEDARNVYQAIGESTAGHLGDSDKWDVHGDAPDNLLEAMAFAADRDLIARQYSNNFAEVFEIAEWIRGWEFSLNERLVRAHVRSLAQNGDTLIGRKCGDKKAEEAKLLAQRTTEWEADAEKYWSLVADLDFWLRSDGHQRNLGATADLVCAATFVCIDQGWILPPFYK